MYIPGGRGSLCGNGCAIALIGARCQLDDVSVYVGSKYVTGAGM